MRLESQSALKLAGSLGGGLRKLEGWERGNWKGKVVITSARLQTRERQTASKEKMGRKRQEGRGDALIHKRNSCKPRWKKVEWIYRKEREREEKGGGNERRGRQ